MITKIKNNVTQKLVVVAADDEEVLQAVRQAQDEDLVKGILIGNEQNIRKVSSEHSISLKDFEIIDEANNSKATLRACEIIRGGKAQIIVKGLVDTSTYMKAILNKEKGLNTGKLLSHVALFELTTYPKLLCVTDPGLNISPKINEKVLIINNAVKTAHALGIEEPLVAACAAVEKVKTDSMPATVDAALLAKMSDRGQIKNCIVDGPFGLDIAISEESARIKKINSPVAGKADIILCHDIVSANYLYKALTFLAKAKAGAIVAGATAPIVLTSRADTHETKYLSIALALHSSAGF